MRTYEQPRAPAHQDQRVGGAGVSAAAGAQIDVLCGGEVNRHVRAAEQIADQQDQ